MLVGIHGHCNSHGCVAGTFCRWSIVLITFSYFICAIFLHWLLNNILISILYHHLWTRCLLMIWLHRLLMPVLTTLKFTRLMCDRIWCTQVHWSIRCMMIAGVHSSSKSLINWCLFPIAFKAISEKMRVLLMCLISKTRHLMLLCIGLIGLLCVINILLVLHVFETYWVLWLVNKLAIVVHLWLTSLGLIYVYTRLCRLLRCFSWTSSWALSTCFDIEPILRDSLHHSCVHSRLLHL